jgi:prevent-host-death family protein
MWFEEGAGDDAGPVGLEGSGWYGPTGGSSTATVGLVATIPQKELRNNVGEVLRRAEAGEQMTITVAGRPVAELGPARTRRWVDTGDLHELWDLPADTGLARDLQAFDAQLRDPWAR